MLRHNCDLGEAVMEGPVGGCVKIWGVLLLCIDELLFNRYLKLIRIAISWKSSSTIKKPCLRLEGKRTRRVGSQRSSGHLELKPWVFRIRQEQGLPWSSDIGGLFLLLLFGGFLMHKLCINSAHQNCSLPPHTHTLLVGIDLFFSDLFWLLYLGWCLLMWKKPSCVIDKSGDNCRGQGMDRGKRREWGKKFQPAPAPSPLPPGVQKKWHCMAQSGKLGGFSPGLWLRGEGRKETI